MRGDVTAWQGSIVVRTNCFDESLAFYVEEVGFKLQSIFPADAPANAVLQGADLTVTLLADEGACPVELDIEVPALSNGETRTLIAPEGSVLKMRADTQMLSMPPLAQSLVVSAFDSGAAWHRGRAGMLYRDLLPEREGGRFIASHIRIPDGGPVPDYVHYHHVRFQMIYCHRGWVKVVYEDQGPPLTMYPGDCVLQPPGIRHQVLEASEGLEVVEIGTPAEHFTHVDHELALPTEALSPQREFGGQQFVFHQAQAANWDAAAMVGFEASDLGLNAATRGVASVKVQRYQSGLETEPFEVAGEFCFFFVLGGSACLNVGPATYTLSEGAACAIPAASQACFTNCDSAFAVLEVLLPGRHDHQTTN